MLQERISLRTADELLAALNAATIPAGPINTISQVFEHPQVLARNMLVEVPHPTAGSVRMTGIPMEFSRTPAEVRRHPPLLGEHTDEILTGLLSKSPAEIEDLRAGGAI
jgi:formyl-CoA transferase